jgi:hypothetical protein
MACFARASLKEALHFSFQHVFFVLRRAFTLVGDNARSCRRDAGGSGTAPSFFARFESLLLAFLQECASQSEFSHADCCQVNRVLKFRS